MLITLARPSLVLPRCANPCGHCWACVFTIEPKSSPSSSQFRDYRLLAARGSVFVVFFRFPRDSMKTTTAALFFLKSHKLLKCAKPGSQTNIYPDTPQKCGIRTIIFPSNRSTAFVPEFKQSIKGNKGGVTSPRTPWSFCRIPNIII